jgi:hypothetical protein
MLNLCFEKLLELGLLQAQEVSPASPTPLDFTSECTNIQFQVKVGYSSLLGSVLTLVGRGTSLWSPGEADRKQFADGC